MLSSSASAKADLLDEADWPYDLEGILVACAKQFTYDVPVKRQKRAEVTSWLLDNCGPEGIECSLDFAEFRGRITAGRWVRFGSRKDEHDCYSFRDKADASAFKLVWYA